MGSLSSAPSRTTRTAALIATEDEAVTVAASLAGVFSLPRAMAADAIETRLDLLSRSGLFGISVPTEQGGIDVSNTVLAEVCAIAAAQSETLGSILAAHFVAVEQIRSHGSDSQRSTVFSAILAGARLARGLAGETDILTFLPSGLGWRLSGAALSTPHARHADWLLVPVRQDGMKATGLLLPAHGDALRHAGESQVLFEDVLVDGDALLHPVGEAGAYSVPRALDVLLEAACRIGAARHALHALLDDPACRPGAAGRLSARLTAASAMLAEAGRAIDGAQIGLADQHRTNAFLAAVDALAVAEDAEAAIRPASGGQVRTAPHLAALLEESGARRLAERRRQPHAET